MALLPQFKTAVFFELQGEREVIKEKALKNITVQTNV